jgi:hypothetical protein
MDPSANSRVGSGIAASDFSTLLQLSSRLNRVESRSIDPSMPVSDPQLDRWLSVRKPYDAGRTVRGTIVLALPYLHCYLVNTGDREPPVLATAGSLSSMSPIGVRSGTTLPVGASVLLWQGDGSQLGYILCVIPEPALYLPAYIQPGSRAEVRKNAAYRSILTASQLGLGIPPQTSGRPIDGRQGEYSLLAETGVGLFIDSFQSFLRVNELCGIWFNYFDNYTKLSGADLDIFSFAQHRQDRADEGELSQFTGHLYYPYEAVGSLTFGINPLQENEAQKVQLDEYFSGAAVEPVRDSQQPVYRVQDYSGYLGHGVRRYVAKPGRPSDNLRAFSTAESYPDTGLFQEVIALDGSYGLRSAKGIIFAKQPVIPVPMRKRDTGDPQGDSAAGQPGNDYRYAFNGIQDGQVVHHAHEWKASPAAQFDPLKRVGGDLDWASHFFHWKAVFPFAYHEQDFYLAETSPEPQLKTEYLTGNYQQSYVESGPVPVEVDERYGRTLLYKLASHLQLTDDGGIVLSDGYGSRILMTGGQVRIESAGDVILTSAARVVSMARDVILRAQDNIDLSAATKDVRIKAENNLQMLGGNSGQGGILLESKGQGTAQLYEQRVGNEVTGSGITLLAKGSSVNAVGTNVYLRSGVNTRSLSGGEIVIDAGAGAGGIQYRANSHVMTTRSGVSLLHVNDEDVPVELHYFSANSSELPGNVSVAGGMSVRSQGISVAGSIVASGAIQTGGNLACRNGILGVGDTSRSNIQSGIDSSVTAYEQNKSQAVEDFQLGLTSFRERYYGPTRPGSEELLLSAIGFSFRDNLNQPYGYDEGGFKFLETRWQQLARIGAGATRTPWREPSVLYQGQQQQPWPGIRNWEDPELQAFLAYAGSAADPNSFDFIDPALGLVRTREERQNKMERPELADWIADLTCSTGFTL